ncbi:hypothetical protein EDB84DRAFT_1188341 [Lactarius hengduanensis]|nr:hypothetical protein EDB84DRAFT_1188341 [Lactarius hengduanensis]
MILITTNFTPTERNRCIFASIHMNLNAISCLKLVLEDEALSLSPSGALVRHSPVAAPDVPRHICGLVHRYHARQLRSAHRLFLCGDIRMTVRTCQSVHGRRRPGDAQKRGPRGCALARARLVSHRSTRRKSLACSRTSSCVGTRRRGFCCFW